MGYAHIDNVYKNPEILLFRECYALEKIHGSSAWLRWDGQRLHYHAGGVKTAQFKQLFDETAVIAGIKQHIDSDVTSMYIYGEVYGGKHQKMSRIYGKELRFVAFDVKIGDNWLNVPNAHDVVSKLGLEFVAYEKGPATKEWLDAQRDAPSVQAMRNGMGNDKEREGVVVRPLIELTKNNGSRIIGKHRIHKYNETATPREISPEKLIVLEKAAAIADEWVVEMRLQHVLQKLEPKRDGFSIQDTGNVIKAMIEDILREAEGEIVWSKEASAAISKRTAFLFKKHLKE